MNLKKKLLTALSVIGIVLAGLSPASAEDFYTVSYGELIQSDNYLELKDLVSQNMTTIAQAKDVEITTTYNLLLDESVEIAKNVIKREGSNTLIQYNSTYGLIEAIRVDKTSYISLGYACAQYYLASWTDAFGVGCGGEANNNRVKKYLKQPKLKYVSFRCTRRNESCNPVNEGYLKVLTGQENLTSIAGNLDLYSYANFDFLFASLLEGSDNSFLNYTRTGMSEYIDYSPVFKIPNPTQSNRIFICSADNFTMDW